MRRAGCCRRRGIKHDGDVDGFAQADAADAAAVSNGEKEKLTKEDKEEMRKEEPK